MSGEIIAQGVIAFTILATTIATYLKSRTVNQGVKDAKTQVDTVSTQVAEELRACKDDRERDRLALQRANRDLEEYKDRVSALETQITVLVKILPGGEWFDRIKGTWEQGFSNDTSA